MFSLSAPSFLDFGPQLRESAHTLRFGFRPVVRHWAELFMAESMAASSWSSRIPGSFTIQGAGDNVVVRAAGDAAPEGAPLENEGKRGTFRHPVFGNREVWVDQKARPFFNPVFLRVTAELPDREMAVFFDETFHSIGYV